ncbi:DHH family phosphoesterase, partial [Patescibacteria group bacterium]
MDDKIWQIADAISKEAKQKFPDLNPVILQLLINRGLDNQEEMDRFLNPDWNRDTFGPELFTNMPVAVKRVFDSLEQNEVITIHGDYDADGVCGTTVLFSALRDLCRQLNYDQNLITYYIPHRETEGYGLSKKTVDHLIEHEKTKLILAVDCGISNKEAIDHAYQNQIDTIICDHHA